MPAAIPILAAAGGAIATAVATKTIVAVAVNIGIAVVATIASRALTKKSNLAPLEAAATARTVTAAGTLDPRRIIYGEARVAGQLVYFGSSGDRNEFLWYVVRWCDHEIESFEAFYLDGVEIDAATQIDGSGFVTLAAFVDVDANNLLRIESYDGSQTVAPANLNAAFSQITAAFIGNDIAYSVFRLELDESEPDDPPGTETVWSKGVPQRFEARIKGAKVYDPRTLTTAWSRNLVLQNRDYLVDSPYGPGYDTALFNSAVLDDSADVCEESVTVWDGAGGTTTQNRYNGDGLVTTDKAHGAIVDDLLTAAAGTLAYQQGELFLFAGEWTAAADSLTTADLGGALEVQLLGAGEGRYNRVIGSHFDPDRSGQLVEYLSRGSSSYVTEDGGQPADETRDFPYTSDPQAAQRLALIALKHSRLQVAFSAECKLSALRFGLHDVINVTLDPFGWTAKTFRITEMAYEPSGFVRLVCREEDSSVWDYTAPPSGSAEIDEPDSAPSDVAPLTGPTPPSGLTATGVSNGIKLAWSNPASDFWRVEIYVATSNDRSTATLLHCTAADSWVHDLAPGDERFYWIVTRARSNLTSAWYPVSSTAGATAIALGDYHDEDDTEYASPISTDYVSIDVDSEGGEVQVGGACTLLPTGKVSALTAIWMKIQRTTGGGLELGRVTLNENWTADVDRVYHVSGVYRDTPGAGLHTYRIERGFSISGGSPTVGVGIANQSIWAVSDN